jgi:hypothetical protein
MDIFKFAIIQRQIQKSGEMNMEMNNRHFVLCRLLALFAIGRHISPRNWEEMEGKSVVRFGTLLREQI